MRTICSNEECRQKYRVNRESLGKNARCKRCNTVFKIVEYVEKDPIQFDIDDDDNQASETQTKRRSSKEIIMEHIQAIEAEVNNFMPQINSALANPSNESDTRLLIDLMLRRILGYDIADIRTEQKVDVGKVDYILSVKDENKLVIEAKRIGLDLKPKHVIQATSYGAYSGIRWAVLTNAAIWQLYHISMDGKVKPDLVFTIDLRDGLDDIEAYHFFLISKAGMQRKGLLEKKWQKISSLCYENVVETILSEDVVSKIRVSLSKQYGCKLDNDEVKRAIEENIIFQLN